MINQFRKSEGQESWSEKTFSQNFPISKKVNIFLKLPICMNTALNKSK